MFNNPSSIVVVIDKFTDEYHIHFVFDNYYEACAFAQGMREAWKINHGPHNVWMPLVLGDQSEFQTWNTLGCPGKEYIESDGTGVILKKSNSSYVIPTRFCSSD